MSENTTWSVSDTEWIPLGFAEYMVRHLQTTSFTGLPVLERLAGNAEAVRQVASRTSRTGSRFEVRWKPFYEEARRYIDERDRKKARARGGHPTLDERITALEARVKALEDFDIFQAMK